MRAGRCCFLREKEGFPEVLKLRYARCRLPFPRGPGSVDVGLDEDGSAMRVKARSAVSVDGVSGWCFASEGT